MAAEHWFDTFNKLLTHNASRRGVLGTFSLILGQCLGASVATAKNVGSEKNSGKKKGKGNGKKHRKRKDKKRNGTGDRAGAGNGAEPTPNPPESCSGGACAQEWAGIDSEIAYCEFICHQCDGEDSREFCIAEGDPNDPAKIAGCCDPPAPHCCDAKCTNRQDDRNNCGTCGNACDADEFCHDGGCVPICHNRDCPEGQLCHNSNNQLGCSGQRTIDCQCGCYGFNYCLQAQGYWACQSNPC